MKTPLRNLDSFALKALLCGLVLGVAPACGPEFDPASEVKSLRALAVLKDKPYALPANEATGTPAEKVKLDLVWHDGKPLAENETSPRPIQVWWYLDCINPAGDVYYGCFEQISQASAASLRLGNSVEFEFKPELMAKYPRSYVGDFPYDIGIAFFVLCAGQVEFGTPSESTPFPLLCRSPQGELLGPDDFVAGYTSIYSFKARIQNQPPAVSDQILFNGQLVKADCTGAACATDVPVVEPNCDDPEQSKLCIPVCEDDGDDSCPDFSFKPVLDQAANAEEDTVTTRRDGRRVEEQMWINYYADRGGVSSDVRLLNDVKTGWNAKYETKFHAPKTPGLIKLWAVVHDSRGGTSVVRVSIRAR